MCDVVCVCVCVHHCMCDVVCVCVCACESYNRYNYSSNGIVNLLFFFFFFNIQSQLEGSNQGLAMEGPVHFIAWCIAWRFTRFSYSVLF